MFFQVVSYNLQDVYSNCPPDDNLNNIILQLNNRTVWIAGQEYKNGDVFEITDPAYIQYFMKQYVFGSTPLLVIAPDPTPGASMQSAFQLTLDNYSNVFNVELVGGQVTWIQIAAMPYSDEIDFYLLSDGITAYGDNILNYGVYQSDGITPIDISGSYINNGTGGIFGDPRDYNHVYFNYYFQEGNVYYFTFIPPYSGIFGIFVFGD